MGKQAKSMPAKRMGSTRTQRNGARPTPYSKKAHVEVRYEGARPKPMDGKLGNLKAVAPELSAKAKGKAKALDTPISKSITSSIPIAPLAQIPASTFVIIAGSYEKLLYGLEGSYKSNSGKPTLKPIFIFPAHLACVKAVAASPGGKWLATGSEDEFVKVWDLRRRKEVGSLSQHEGSITSLYFPTASHLLTTSVDGTLCLFRTTDWALLKSLRGHSGRVNHVDVHPTGRVALSVGKDGTLRMWDLMRGRGAASLPLGDEAEQVKFSPLGTHFAVLFPKKIQIYSLNLRLLDTVTTTSRFHSCLFASPPSSKASQFDDLGEADLLLMGTEKGIVEVYRVSIEHGGLAEEDSEEKEDADGVDDSGAKVEKLGVLVGHKNRVKSISSLPFFLPSSSTGESRPTVLLTSVSSDGLVNLYDLASFLSVNEQNSGEDRTASPIASYDTKGSRLTCVFLADGKSIMASNGHVIMKGKPNGQHGAEQVAGGHEVSQDGEDLDSPAHMYESLEEEYTTLDGSEGTGVDVAFEDEEEEED